MFDLNEIFEILISLQIIIISTLIPVFISIPYTNKLISTIEIPITWQIPSIIVLTLLFKGKIIIKSFSIYLIIVLFFIPVFNQGGSIGYLLTPNFGFLLGTFPLIKIIDNLNNKNKKIIYYDFLKYGILGISSMHLVGIIYSSIQLFNIKQSEILLYSIAKLSLGKLGYHLLMLIPITLFIKLINKYRY